MTEAMDEQAKVHVSPSVVGCITPRFSFPIPCNFISNNRLSKDQFSVVCQHRSFVLGSKEPAAVRDEFAAAGDGPCLGSVAEPRG